MASLGFNVSDILKNKKFVIGGDIRCFLKLIGVSGNPFTRDRIIGDRLHFSKRSPRTVRKDVVLICYGVGSTKLLGYFKFMSNPE